MAPQNNKRRLVEDYDSESDSERRDSWAKYIILSTIDEDEKPVTKLSPFVIEKTLKGIIELYECSWTFSYAFHD